MATETPKKPIHSLILDTGPLIKNAVSISSIINSAEEIFTTSAIISEIRDAATRSRVQTTLMPFLKVRTPSPASYDAVVAFSKKTGDYAALSRQDLGVLALAYEVHCERNGGPWGLREAPKQPIKTRPGEEKLADEEDEKPADEEEKEEVTKATTEDQAQTTEGKPKKVHKKKERKRLAREALESEIGKASEAEQPGEAGITSEAAQSSSDQEPLVEESSALQRDLIEEQTSQGVSNPNPDAVEKDTSTIDQTAQEVGQARPENVQPDALEKVSESPIASAEDGDAHVPQSEPAPSTAQDASVAEGVAETQANQHQEFEAPASNQEPTPDDPEVASAHEDFSKDVSNLTISTPPSPPATDDDTDSDSDWITPSNLHDRQAADAGLLSSNSHASTELVAQLDVATMTTDFAMQNVLLQMNLQLLSPNMQRIKHLVSKVLRCHACFLIERDTSRQFCPRCGGASLLRVNCSTNARGEFRLHLAKNYTYNKRGDKYSIPKPIAGTANGKWNGIGGGQGGWGRDLVLAEDQKEYVKMVEEKKKKAARDMMDEDYLPGILTGDRSGRAGGRVKVGAGKNVNSKRRV